METTITLEQAVELASLHYHKNELVEAETVCNAILAVHPQEITALHIKQLIRAKSSPFTKDNPSYSQYEIGEYTYGKPQVLSWGEGTTLSIGKYCSIEEGVMIFLGGEHRVDWVTTYPFNALFSSASHYLGHPKSKGNVIIGNDVWIGAKAVILSGVSIGNGAVIGTHSVVTKDVPAYSIVAGNPAKHIKLRFEQNIISRLQEIAWWEWNHEQVMQALPFLLSSDIQNFIDKYS